MDQFEQVRVFESQSDAEDFVQYLYNSGSEGWVEKVNEVQCKVHWSQYGE